ncbi:MAG: hypothetical protein E6I94_08460 [Chloroflexi bacterium]|nr:MAG: hypothetical protein E6I94_08460 [Chloroflexota bacterium]
MSAPEAAPTRPTTAIGYFWGDDGYGLDLAAASVGRRLADESGVAPDRWTVAGGDATPERIGERVATATLFGGGTLVVVTDPWPLIRGREARDAVVALLGTVAPGNGLVFVDPMERVPKTLDAARAALAAAVRSGGGEARQLMAPNAAGMVRWIEDRAKERSIALGQGSAPEIARRLGGLVREGDVDRRRQGQLAVAELEKLALLHLDGGQVTEDDVRALVPEAIPGSTFGFLDALGERRIRDAAGHLERILESTPEPVVLVQMYGRVRQLLDIADRLAAGQGSRDLASLRLNPYFLDKLVRQAHAWSVPELEAALIGLLDLDVRVKGADGTTSTEGGRRLAFALWLAEHVGRMPAPDGRVARAGHAAARGS